MFVKRTITSAMCAVVTTQLDNNTFRTVHVSSAGQEDEPKTTYNIFQAVKEHNALIVKHSPRLVPLLVLCPFCEVYHHLTDPCSNCGRMAA